MQNKFISYMDNSQIGIAGLFAAKLKEEVNKIKTIDDIEKITLHIPELEDHLIISNLLGRLDEKEIQLLNSEFEEIKGIDIDELNIFQLPFEEAIKFFTNKTPELIENLDEITEEIRANYFWLKKNTSLTATEKLFKSLGNNIKNGGTFKKWLKDIDNIIKKEGLTENGWYWENVYRNANMSSYNAGHWEQQQDSKEDFPYLQYDGIRDGREQEHTKKFDGKLFPVDHEFWKKYYPPNGYFCRCGTIALTKEELEEEGLKVNRYTKALKNIDVGTFDNNPGIPYLDSMKKSIEDKQKDIKKLSKKIKEKSE